MKNTESRFVSRSAVNVTPYRFYYFVFDLNWISPRDVVFIRVLYREKKYIQRKKHWIFLEKSCLSTLYSDICVNSLISIVHKYYRLSPKKTGFVGINCIVE